MYLLAVLGLQGIKVLAVLAAAIFFPYRGLVDTLYSTQLAKYAKFVKFTAMPVTE